MQRKNTPLKCFPLLYLLLAVLPGWASADLVFEMNKIELYADAKAEEISGVFLFRNDGFETVKIVEIESTCGCLSASMTKESYEPGERGKMGAVFKLDNFIGTHKKMLIVTTSDHKQRPVELEVVIHVPEVIRVTPDLHEWTVGGATEPKVFSVEILGDTPINITEVGATRKNVDHELKVVEPGRKYQISMKPQSTEKIMVGALRVTTDSDVPKFQRRLLYFAVSKEGKELGDGDE